MSERKAATTRTVLMTAMLLLMTALTGASLLIVGRRMRQQVAADFSLQLSRAAVAFRNAEAERLHALKREDDLLADLPSLKALLTTNDDRTIEDGALEFWRTSGDDLFALLGPNLRLRAVYARGLPSGSLLQRDLAKAVRAPGQTYLLSGGHLFRYAVSPVYFGNADSGTLLGYTISGYAVDAAYLARIAGMSEADCAFVSGNAVLASSTALPYRNAGAVLGRVSPGAAQSLQLDGERYLGTSRDLSAQSSAPLALVLFKSLRVPEREIHDINRLLLVVGFSIVLLGSLGMLLVARTLTQPLENLTRRVRAFGSGGARTPAPQGGTREVQQLAEDFQRMQERIEHSNRARLESERLATIGSMASSVSHDLRHYLASIYANAEFLAAADTSDRERVEFLQDIRTAVMGTTEMLESLMIFGQTGQSVRHAPEQMEVLVRRAVAQVRTHPEIADVRVSSDLEAGDTGVIANGKQLERAIYNLLLNACQAALMGAAEPAVSVVIVPDADSVAVRVTDSGPGVADAVQTTLFEPFVSQGKQNGTGLGLTLCRCIAEEHDGKVTLLSSVPGETVFELRLPRIGVDVDVQEAAELQPEGAEG